MKSYKTLVVFLFVFINSFIIIFFLKNNNKKVLPFNYFSNLIVAPPTTFYTTKYNRFLFYRILKVDNIEIKSSYFLSDYLNRDNKEFIAISFLSYSNQPSVIKLEKVALKKVNWNYFWDNYSLPFIIINIFLIFSFLLAKFSNDAPLFIYCLSVALILFSALELLFLGNFWLLALFSVFLMVFSFLNIGISIQQREISKNIYLLQFFVILFLSFIFKDAYKNFHSFYFVLTSIYIFFLLALFILLLYLLFHLFKSYKQKSKKVIIWYLLLFVLAFGVSSIIFFHGYANKPMGLFWPLFYPGLLLFPMGIVFINYKYKLIALRNIFDRSLYYAISVSIILSLYGIFLFVYLRFYNRSSETQFIFDISLIIIFVFFLAPIQALVSKVLKRAAFNKEIELSFYLQKIAVLVSNPVEIAKTIKDIVIMLEEVLEVETVSFLLYPDSFPLLKENPPYIVRLGADCQMDCYFSLLNEKNELLKSERLGSISGDGNSSYYEIIQGKKTYFVFHISNSSKDSNQIAASLLKEMEKHVCVVVGPKKSKKSFYVEEIKFLSQATYFFDLLFKNYNLLLANLQKRRYERELQLSYEIQSELLPPKNYKLQGYDIQYFSNPAVGVSGDYLDIFSTSTKDLVIVLGDISGHGLGSSYLMVAVRSVFRSLLYSKKSLSECFYSLNEFLRDRYRGSEFLTLFVGHLDLESGKLEYINAGHPKPYYYKNSSKRFNNLKKTQTLLGVVPMQYTSRSFQFNKGDSLFLYSDGIIEQFNAKEQAYGSYRLSKFLRDNIHAELDVIVPMLQYKIHKFKKEEPWSDDASFMAIRRREDEIV